MLFLWELCLLFDLLLGTAQTKSSSQLIIWWTLWINCQTSFITPVSIWRWPLIRWRPTTTAWSVLLDSRKEAKSDCTAWTRPEESPKLQPSREGPYKVIIQISEFGLQYPATTMGEDKEQTVHCFMPECCISLPTILLFCVWRVNWNLKGKFHPSWKSIKFYFCSKVGIRTPHLCCMVCKTSDRMTKWVLSNTNHCSNNVERAKKYGLYFHCLMYIDYIAAVPCLKSHFSLACSTHTSLQNCQTSTHCGCPQQLFTDPMTVCWTSEASRAKQRLLDPCWTVLENTRNYSGSVLGGALIYECLWLAQPPEHLGM
jgi:hypothetical protein